MDSLGGYCMMKKSLLFIMIIVMVYVGVSCGIYSSATADKKRSEELLQYLSDKDVEGLKGMFCSKIAKGVTFEDEIEAAMEFFKGKVKSHDPMIGGGNSSAIERGRIIRYEIRPLIRNIETDAGKMYEIKFYSYHIHVEQEDVVGISLLTIKDTETDEIYQVGELID